jgi:hypothetical protein
MAVTTTALQRDTCPLAQLDRDTNSLVIGNGFKVTDPGHLKFPQPEPLSENEDPATICEAEAVCASFTTDDDAIVHKTHRTPARNWIDEVPATPDLFKEDDGRKQI